MSFGNIIPTLAKIAFHIRHRWSFDECVHIMPVVRRAIVGVATQWRGIVMQVRVPAVIVTAELNQHVDAADEGMGAVHDRRLLMK